MRERLGSSAAWVSVWAVLGAAWDYARSSLWKGALRGGVWGVAGGATKEAIELTAAADAHCGALPQFKNPEPIPADEWHMVHEE